MKEVTVSNPKPPTEYIVDDQELLLGFYKKLLWDRLVKRIPASIAPNSITILGQVCAILAVITAAAAAGGHPILYVVSAALLLGYLTCDNVDGAHARRTGQASPLGEFLDHGLDGLASAATLVITGIILRIDAVPFVLLCTLAAAGFALVFWEQFRTGLLVIAKFSATEGVTFLILVELLMAFTGDPTWLHFSMTEFTVGTAIVGVVLIGYAGAMAPPMIRASQKGTKLWELLPVLAVAGSAVAFPVLGGNALIPAVAVGVFGADIVCRMIVLRHRGATGPILSPIHLLMVIPVAPAALAPDAWTVTGWSAVALIVSVTSYSWTLYRGATEMIERHEASQNETGAHAGA